MRNHSIVIRGGVCEVVLKDRLSTAKDGLVGGEVVLLAALRHVGSRGHAKLDEWPPVPPFGVSQLRAGERHPTALKQVVGAD